MSEITELIFRHRLLTIATLIIILISIIPISLSVGVYGVSLGDLLKLLIGDLPVEVMEVLLLRLRRVLAALFIGIILGGGGVAMQAVLRNPMASPFTLGIANAAALGVAVALLTGTVGSVSRWVITVYNPFLLPLIAFTFSVTQVLMILLLAYRAGLSEVALILAALAMNFSYQAVLYLIQYLALNELQVAIVIFWTFGDVGRVGWLDLWIITLTAIAITMYYVLRSPDLDLLSLGDDVAASSGVKPKRLRFETSVITAIGTSVVTSFAGVIAFLCLIAPHIARLIVGNAHRYLIPTSMIIGSILLICADVFGRVIISPVILPVGITLSLIGAPLLMYLLLRR